MIVRSDGGRGLDGGIDVLQRLSYVPVVSACIPAVVIIVRVCPIEGDCVVEIFLSQLEVLQGVMRHPAVVEVVWILEVDLDCAVVARERCGKVTFLVIAQAEVVPTGRVAGEGGVE